MLIQLLFFKTLLLLSNLKPQRKQLKKSKNNKSFLKKLKLRLTSWEKFIEELPLKEPCYISCLFNFASLIRCTSTLLNPSPLSSSRLSKRQNWMRMMKSELLLSEIPLEWQFTNGLPEVSSRNINKFSDANWPSDLCKNKLSRSNTKSKRCNSYFNAHPAQSFQTHWKNGFQISLGTQSPSLSKSKDSNNSQLTLRKRLQTDSKIGTTSLLQRMRNFLLSGKNLTNNLSKNFWLSDAWDQIELPLLWITSLERLFQRVTAMLIVIQHPASTRSYFLLSLIPPLLLQFTSSCHQELIQSSL